MVGNRSLSLGVSVQRRENIVMAVVAAGIYLLFELGKVVGIAGLNVRTAVLSIVIGTLAFGVTARWGVFLGLLTTGLVSGDWVGGAVAGLAGMLATVIIARLWQFPDPKSQGRWLVSYLGIVPVAVIAYAVCFAALTDLIGTVSFDIVFVQLVGGNLPIALVGLPLAWVFARCSVESDLLVVPQPVKQPRRAIAVTVLFLWALGSYVGSFMFRVVSVIPPARIGERVHPVAELLVLLAGYQGSHVIFLCNLLAVTAVLSVLYRDGVDRIQQRWAEQWS